MPDCRWRHWQQRHRYRRYVIVKLMQRNVSASMHTKDLARQLGCTRTSKQPGISGVPHCHAAVNQPTASTLLHTEQSSTSTSTVNSVSVSVSAVPAVVSARHSQPSARHVGQCQSCFRTVSLTSVGVLYKHGPNCPGSGQPPRTQAQAQHSTNVVDINSTSPSSTDTVSSSTSASNILETINDYRRRVLRRIPKASRIPAANKLADILSSISREPDNIDNWLHLLLFSYTCLGVPGQRGGRRHKSSLATRVNKAVSDFPTVVQSSQGDRRQKLSASRSTSNFAARVSSKLEEGDVKGAVQLAASDMSLAPFDESTADVLRGKHPARTAVSTPPSPTSIDACLTLSS